MRAGMEANLQGKAKTRTEMGIKMNMATTKIGLSLTG